MNTALQTVTLRSPHHYGHKVPSEALGQLLECLPNALRYAVRMSIEGRSRARGKPPEWLKAAADIRFVAHQGRDETVLQFEAPRLGEAAAKIYEQGELWANRPDPADTAFDLLGDVITEVSKRNEDSPVFDRALLNQVTKFRPLNTGAFSAMAITGRRYTPDRAAVLTPAIVEIARTLASEMPPPRRIRLSGKLDMLRVSTQAFGLILMDGQEVPGVVLHGDMSALAPLFQKNVLVLGKAVYRPSGRLLRIDAEAIGLAAPDDRFFSHVPQPRRKKPGLGELHRAQAQKKGLAVLYGQWPGDETDEDVERILKELS